MTQIVINRDQVHGTNMKKKVTMCDPPSGWKYGYPKAMPKTFDTFEEHRAWLVSEGYPQKLIDEFGDHFYCRYWQEEVEINEN